ncbi:SusD/RagB family nutrient-binding outer membrane lipoprotein [Myroides guanonis]|uniref:Susd and RagB outer membrane lipoprotein n=1 Tax=Myroides guanonis TaxID=1150112 RepID=A0A1I3MCQ0_9FLAO|nr:SusD/RagB family nutrient-binding outer membrane lipoprotein [Myroides guanonis]SFI94753.1 Susd and RagB outer membrane lipoprotein [Myroides guanonis]
MKQIKYIVAGFLGMLALQSCSEDTMDDINNNQNDPEYVESRFILTDVMNATAFSVTGSDLSFYTGIYAELHAGVDNQMFRAQTRQGEPQLSTTYNNSWNTLYRQLAPLQEVIEKCSEGGSEAGNYETLGIAQVLYAYNLAVLTDLFGDVPLKEAMQPGVIFQPKIDSQEYIYSVVFENLNSALENLNKTSKYTPVSKQDVIFEGNLDNWEKAANGLLARYTMRLSLRKPDYQKVIDYVDASFKNSLEFPFREEFVLRNEGIPNPFARFYNDRKGLGTIDTFYELMLSNGDSDVRTQKFFTVNKDTVVVAFDSKASKPVQSTTLYSVSGMMSEKNPIYMLGYHELLFLKAEAQARLGQDADALVTLKDAVTAAFTKNQDVKFTVEEANTYTATFDGLAGRDLLKKIMNEKHISFYENEGIEAYNDIRRLQAMGDGDLIKLNNPGKFPKRLTYGASDVAANSHIKAAFGDGTYVYTEDVWWAGGTR